MNLYLLRHASAGTRRTNPTIDNKRPIDKAGREHCVHLAQVLNTFDLNFDLILSSPLKRCLQTASFVGTETGYDAPIQIARALAPAGTYAEFQQLVAQCAKHENVLMVGHNPNITHFLGSLLTPAASKATAAVRMRKGSIARVAFPAERGEKQPATLSWLLDPRMVRALYINSAKSSRRKTSRK
jgi:phosphohistidine phosphatase